MRIWCWYIPCERRLGSLIFILSYIDRRWNLSRIFILILLKLVGWLFCINWLVLVLLSSYLSFFWRIFGIIRWHFRFILRRNGFLTVILFSLTNERTGTPELSFWTSIWIGYRKQMKWYVWLFWISVLSRRVWTWLVCLSSRWWLICGICLVLIIGNSLHGFL